MTHACIYQHGMRAYLEGLPLSGNPYSLAFGLDAHEAWRNGWLEASRARGRLRAHEAAALRTQRQGRDSFSSQLLANGLAHSAAASII